MAKSLKLAGLSLVDPLIVIFLFRQITDLNLKHYSQMLGINQVVAHNGNGGRERIGETGTVLGLNARDSKHAGRMFSMHNCQINPGAGPEITTPWKSYQHEKNRNGLMPLIRRRTMLQL